MVVRGLGRAFLCLSVYEKTARPPDLHSRDTARMSLSSEPKGCWTTVERPPRRVYIDAGANWANTLRLYRDELDTLSQFPVARSTSSQPWEIYAFEASPVIQPFVEDFVKHLNGLAPRPALLVPPIGSSRSHAQYSRIFNCTVASQSRIQ